VATLVDDDLRFIPGVNRSEVDKTADVWCRALAKRGRYADNENCLMMRSLFFWHNVQM